MKDYKESVKGSDDKVDMSKASKVYYEKKKKIEDAFIKLLINRI